MGFRFFRFRRQRHRLQIVRTFWKGKRAREPQTDTLVAGHFVRNGHVSEVNCVQVILAHLTQVDPQDNLKKHSNGNSMCVR